MLTELIEDNLAAKVAEGKKVAVQFSAGWCGNCRMIKPKFKRLAGETENVEFLIVDAEKLPESRKLAKVDNLPTFAIFEHGKLVNQLQTNKIDIVKALIDEIAAN